VSKNRERITTLAHQVRDHYVFPDAGARVAALLHERLADDAYRDLPDEHLAAVVTSDMQARHGDPHLRLLYSPAALPEQADEVRRLPGEAALAGHGIARVELLAGNVGLLDLRRLYRPEESGAAVVAALGVVADADVLVIDLRGNTGGDPSMVALVCGHLFDDAIHLNDIEDRLLGVVRQYWTTPVVSGRSFGGTKPVYVLTSGTTFSGAEELAYGLQQLGRAGLIGETTRGGAHPSTRWRIDEHLMSSVPTARAVNPVSGTNWEGVGVVPDVPVAEEHALDIAYRLALTHVLTLGADGARRSVAEQARQALADLG
jgi:C-terminal processing protease CtpA/Prc